MGRRLAAEILDSFQDGACLVELGALADPSLVYQAVGIALGIRDQPGTPLLHTLVSVLHARRMLLVLDDCEHLSEACAALAAGLLRGCPQLHILATSRVVLNVAGEMTWQVPALSLPDPTTLVSLTRSDAVCLFVERARAVRPDFSLTDDIATTVGEVCVRLDGLALALELAAAWIRTLSIQQLASRLNDRFAVLVGGASNVPSRQRTLRATLDWSYALLDDVEQRLFDRLAVFVGGATLDAIEAVCQDDDTDGAFTLGTLRRLVEASLVSSMPGPFGEPRYSMLDMIGEYARERLADRPEASELDARHAAYYVALVQRPDYDMWGLRPGEPACLSLGAMLCHQGDTERATRLCREGLALSLEAADDTALQLGLDGLARVANREGRHERAARLLGAADACYEAMGVQWPRNPYAPPPSHLEFVAHVRESLGVERFARLSDEARAWSRHRALAYALHTGVDETTHTGSVLDIRSVLRDPGAGAESTTDAVVGQTTRLPRASC